MAEPLPVDARRATELVSIATRQAAATALGVRATTDEDLPRAVVWESGADSLLVLLETVTVEASDGLVGVGVDVACDELWEVTGQPRVRVRVDLVVGTEQRPTGLLAAATAPHGPHVVVDRWADELVAFAWQALLDSAAGLTAVAGTDTDGAPLIPTSWTASPNGVSVGPQARHRVDRRITTATRP
ncbi:MAG: hypothetical protein ACRDTF_25160 [Pseudonocardiaceae bacterium]